MLNIYAILIYLNTVCPCHYTQSQMNLIINQNQVRINQVQNDAQLNAFVQGEFTDEASLVVIDYDEN